MTAGITTQSEHPRNAIPKKATASVHATPGHNNQYRGLGYSAVENVLDMVVYDAKPGSAASVLFDGLPNANSTNTRYGPNKPLPQKLACW